MRPFDSAGLGHQSPIPMAFQRGFSYLWMLLMVAFMSVGLVLACDVQTTASQRDHEAELLAIGEQFRYALTSYYQAQLPSNAVGIGTEFSFAQAVSGSPPAAGGAFIASVPGRALGAGAMPQIDLLRYPTTLDELLKDNRFPGVRRHLRKVFVDPMTKKAEWGLVQVSGRIVGVHSLSIAVPIKQAGFDDENQSFTGAQSYTQWVFGFTSQMPVQGDATGTALDGTSTNLSLDPDVGRATH